MKKILIFGGYSYLGNQLCNYLKNITGLEIYRQGRGERAKYQVDPSDFSECYLLIKKVKPDVIINLIAETNIEACETNPKLATVANSLIIRNIKDSIAMSDMKSYLIHISTDQVYSGKGPHKENKTNPLNIYAKTKLDGEMTLVGTNSIVLRTNFIGRSTVDHRTSLSDWIVESLTSGKKINVFSDIIFNPLHISTLCEEIYKIIIIQKTGIYNLGSSDFISKADFAITLSKYIGLDTRLLNRCKSSDINLFKAKRNSDMTMNVQKYKNNFNSNMPCIDKEILKTAEEYTKI